MATRELSDSPSMLALNAKAAAYSLPRSSLVPFVGSRRDEDLPDLDLVLRDVSVDPDHLAAYSRVCGMRVRDELPATYPHVLAFPLHLALFTQRGFPFPVVGLVHFGNRITQHRPIRLGEALTLRVSSTGLERHPKGRKFEVLGEGRVGDELVWQDVSTFLHREGGGSGDRGEGEDRAEEVPASAKWRVERAVGRRYAEVSGDRNPIHVYRLAARLSGFPDIIAPGMWTKARSLAALEGHLPEAFTVDVQFKRPIVLPASVAFGSRREGEGCAIAVHDASTGKPHLLGTVEPV